MIQKSFTKGLNTKKRVVLELIKVILRFRGSSQRINLFHQAKTLFCFISYFSFFGPSACVAHTCTLFWLSPINSLFLKLILNGTEISGSLFYIRPILFFLASLILKGVSKMSQPSISGTKVRILL